MPKDLVSDQYGRRVEVTGSQVETFKQKGLIVYSHKEPIDSLTPDRFIWNVHPEFRICSLGEDGEVCLKARV